MADRHDVIVVGARCAGAPLATLLARAGLDVMVVERATFPHDTLSTHILEADGLAFLDHLGVIDEVRATGAPFVGQIDNRSEDVCFTAPWPRRPEDPGGLVSIRRFVLDPILARAAEQAGVSVRMGAKVTELLREDGRVTGVRLDGGEELRGRLVVGADGRNSTVARLCGSRKYNLTPHQRAAYWGYFEGAEIGEPTFAFHRWSDRLVLGIPTDGGLYEVQVLPDKVEVDEFRRDIEGRFMEHATSCEPVARAIEGARRVGRFFRMERWEGFFREAAGPGWVLVGDAGHFKDPVGGRGMGDAFAQAERLASKIASSIGGSNADLDRAAARWARWRDRKFAEHYWFSTDFGAGGSPPAILPEVVRGLHARGRADRIFDIQNHRRSPSSVIVPNVPGATLRAVRRNRGRRLEVLRQVGELLAEDARRRFRNRFPEYADDDAAARDAGPTEVDEVSGGDAARARPHAAA